MTESLIEGLIWIFDIGHFSKIWKKTNLSNFLKFFQCILLALKTSHVLVRYAMFLYDMRQGGMASDGK